MKASTHTEIYRRFDGGIRERALRFVTIAWAGVRVAWRRKLPLTLLYFVPVISCIVVSFLVHLKFMQLEDVAPTTNPAVALGMAQLGKAIGEVSEWIVAYLAVTSGFALLAVAWFGGGLIAEDRRLGAHLLYFSRPITRWDYVFGKFLTVAFFAACATLIPQLVVCSTASFSSPEWSFLKEEWDVILKTVAFSTMWITSVSALVLAISSLVDRKGLALAGFFGVIFLGEALANVLSKLIDDDRFRVLSLASNYGRVGEWLFGIDDVTTWSHELSLTALGVLFVTCCAILVWRVRRMEAVA